jgi:transcriptional regulator with XRE-family HTH domain
MKRTLVEQLQGAIRASGLTLNELERRCGVSHAVLSRFLTGKRTLTLPLAAKVCETLGLELRPSGAEQDGAGPGAKPASGRRRKGGTSS